MNIFVTDISPLISAQNLCDVHVNKMLLESTQLLSTFLSKNDIKTNYLPTHINHPCQLWVSKDHSGKNLFWLYNHALSLSTEFEFRFNKKHKCLFELINIENDLFKFISSKELPESFVQCMPEIFYENDAIKAYRNFYISKQFTMKVPMKWTKRSLPDWFVKF